MGLYFVPQTEGRLKMMNLNKNICKLDHYGDKAIIIRLFD